MIKTTEHSIPHPAVLRQDGGDEDGYLLVVKIESHESGNGKVSRRETGVLAASLAKLCDTPLKLCNIDVSR